MAILKRNILLVSLLVLATGAASATTLREMAGQMMLVGFRGLTIPATSPLVQDIAAGYVGGVILFDRDVLTGSRQRNIESVPQVRDLIASLQYRAPLPLFIAVDQEGGRVSRLKSEHGFRALASHAQLGAGDVARTFREVRDTARELAAVGINLNFAPVLDLNTNPENPVIGKLGRSFSADPEQVARHGAQYAAALRSEKIIPVLKHFPGHGSSQHDSHLGFTDITHTWTPQELEPYRMLIADGFHGMVMTGHIFNQNIDRHFPATLSAPVLQGMLRRELGFQGVIVSDDMQMKAITEHYGFEEAIRQAILAGVDILLFGNNLEYDPHIARKGVEIIVQLVEQGVLSQERIWESYQRICELKQQVGIASCKYDDKVTK
ncbi:glycoside hydrolase family 3 protein [Chrysiogenes arsenatis]|uniref:glycoside hydrolase family 3 protein n=1 Tax=Chrysiogenes arsenatis TaxID=309797 RepID=UPI000405C444|nr:glycoside hydrolase family 3 protein [Chrysiogenes arsenatis]